MANHVTAAERTLWRWAAITHIRVARDGTILNRDQVVRLLMNQYGISESLAKSATTSALLTARRLIFQAV